MTVAQSRNVVYGLINEMQVVMEGRIAGRYEHMRGTRYRPCRWQGFNR